MNTNKLPNTNTERTYQDVQRTDFMKQTYEKEAEALGITFEGSSKLTKQQMQLLDTIRDMDKKPCPIQYPGTNRSEAQVAASVEMHKRVNPGYVDMPYKATNAEAFKYIAPPDFTRTYLKKKSDCDFQGFAAEAILKHVDLKKTSH